ncbi:MAG: hypothetical protein KKA60_08525 [Proteobacteria bacterium]|nr:hypothetical protein [Pseudomonadota bacterium]
MRGFFLPFSPSRDPAHDAVGRAAARLGRKLAGVDPFSLPVSDYSRRYLSDKLASLPQVMALYTHILSACLSATGKDPGELAVVDYGGGTGMLSLLAREAGARTVVYLDIYGLSCVDAASLAKSLDLSADHYVEGDVEALFSFLETSGLVPDVVASYDVIEHVYDILGFFRRLGDLPRETALVMASGANEANPLLRRRLSAIHRWVETEGQEARWGQKERDCKTAYLTERETILSAEFVRLGIDPQPPGLGELARRTRGLAGEDLCLAAARFLETGDLPEPPAHPTNTCDPHTGNWAENLLDPQDLVRVLREAGRPARVAPGLYGPGGRGAKDAAKRLANLFIRAAGSRALFAAPFYTVISPSG